MRLALPTSCLLMVGLAGCGGGGATSNAIQVTPTGTATPAPAPTPTPSPTPTPTPTPTAALSGSAFVVASAVFSQAPAVAALPDGGFVVAFVGSSGSTIQAAVFDASARQRFMVQAGIGVGNVSVAALDTGGFVVAWGSGVHSQAFDASGQPVGSAFSYQTATSDTGAISPRVIDLPGAGYLLAWTLANSAQSPATTKVQFQFVADNGAAKGAPVDASDFASGGGLTGLTALSSGSFVLAYANHATSGGAENIRFQIRGADGRLVAGPTDVSLTDHIDNSGNVGAIAGLPGGGFALLGAVAVISGQQQSSELRIFAGDGTQSAARSLGVVDTTPAITGTTQAVLVAGLPGTQKLQLRLYDRSAVQSGQSVDGATAQPGNPALAFLTGGKAVMVYVDNGTVYGQLVSVGS